MNRELWRKWSGEKALAFKDQPWLLSKWETVEGIIWPPEKISLMVSDIAEKLELDPSHWLLDLACGPGWIGELLGERAAKVIAVDFAEPMIQLAAGRKKVAALLADCAALPLASHTADRALLYFTLMNIKDHGLLLGLLQEALRVLKPGGRLLLGQMPLKSKSGEYDREKARYLEYCRKRYRLGKDLSRDHAPPIVLFEDDYHLRLEKELGAKVVVFDSWNHFWREGEPVRAGWRKDYLVVKPE